MAFSFMPSGRNTNTKLVRDISYYWFDTSGNFIIQNTIEQEFLRTGYTIGTDNPKTLQEKGFEPGNVDPGPPPTPDNFNFPDQKLYSHP